MTWAYSCVRFRNLSLFATHPCLPGTHPPRFVLSLLELRPVFKLASVFPFSFDLSASNHSKNNNNNTAATTTTTTTTNTTNNNNKFN